MSIELATKYAPLTDEKFAVESKKSLVTNEDLDWVNANTVKVYRVSTSEMHDYDREGSGTENWSRYGSVAGLDATTQLMTLTKDRSFTFAIDKLDSDETVQQLQAASALERQLREVVIPEVDTYTFGVMCAKAGSKPTAKALTAANIYAEIVAGNYALDTAEVPDTGRYIIVTPELYILMKQSPDIIMETDVGNEMRLRGVISMLDGAGVIRIPAPRLPNKFGFMIAHPVATVAPTKLADYTIHQNPPGISGDLVEGRINYDAFVLDNKAKALYYQATA